MRWGAFFVTSLALAELIGASGQMSMPPPQSTLPNMALNPGSFGVALARQRSGMKQPAANMEAIQNMAHFMEAQGTQPQIGAPGVPYRKVGEFTVPGFNLPGSDNQQMRAGTPSAPSSPAQPARPFLNKLADMLSGVLGGGMRAFGGAIKTVTGAGSLSVFSGILGMMGYAGPYGYDPFGPGQSMDPYAQSMPETNSCYQLLETWLKQCSAQPESFLEITSITTIAPQSTKNDDTTSTRPETSTIGIKVTAKGVHVKTDSEDIIFANTTDKDSHFTSFLESGQFDLNQAAMHAPLPAEARQHAQHLLDQIGNLNTRPAGVSTASLLSPMSGFQGVGNNVNQFGGNQFGSTQFGGNQFGGTQFGGDHFGGQSPPSMPGFGQLDPSRPMLPSGLQGLQGTRPMAPMFPNPKPESPDSPAPPQRPGMFDQIASGSGMNPAMGGMVSQTLGPDSYNPWVADGAEPDEFQISGPEKCTRMMNNWLYKCALSPM